jgi:hypothetical protein
LIAPPHTPPPISFTTIKLAVGFVSQRICLCLSSEQSSPFSVFQCGHWRIYITFIVSRLEINTLCTALVFALATCSVISVLWLVGLTCNPRTSWRML